MGGQRCASLRLFVIAPTVALLAAVALTASPTGRLAAGKQGGVAAFRPEVGHAVGFAVSPPVSELPDRILSGVTSGADVTMPPLRALPRGQRLAAGASTGDGAIQTYAPPLIPLPSLSFDGLSSQDDFNAFGIRGSPPDTNGDVGLNHYVQAVNLLVRVFNKSGVALTAPFKISSLFAAASVPGVCSAANDKGDPIVLYDPLANQWLLSQFAFTSSSTPPYHQCIAISTTGDPTGSYFLYDFIMPGSNLNDYPKFGVWADAYYMTDNQFLNGGSFNGAGAFAFERAKMLVGDQNASFIYFDLGTSFSGMLPADVDGLTRPPAGAPNYFGMLESEELGLPDDAPSVSTDSMRLFTFHADFANPAASTFSELPESPLAVAAFDPLNPGGRADIEQPPPATSLSYVDSIQDRLMHRLAYRNFADKRESLVVTHTVNVGPDPTTVAGHQAAIRYYEFRRSLPGGAFTVPEQATFAPDTDNRWMGSAAMDGQGNIAVGYSVSSLTTFPSIRYAGRLASDPPNGLFQGEGVLAVGSGVQLSTGGRWGDYSALSVDPADDCTFWYTNEYYTAASQATSTVGWLTRIGTFRFPNCGVQSPQGTVTGQVTDVATGAPVAGAVVSFSPGGFGVATNATGTYVATVPTGTYALTASVPNHPFQSVFGVVVTNASTTTVNFALSLPPNAGILTGRVRNAATNAPIANALVSAGSVSSTTDATGLYALNLPVGTYTVTVSALFYVSTSASLAISNQGLTTRDFALALPANTGFLSGHVRNGTTNAPVANVVVSAGGSSSTTNVAGFYSLYLSAATYTVTASAVDYLDTSAAGVVVANQLTTTRDLTLQPVVFTQTAAYDATLQAPKCGQPGGTCDSATLLAGRDTLSGGAELNQPNTILNSCADGTGGTFHVQGGSIDRIEMYATDGGAFAVGKTVRVQTTVWAYSPSDRLDLYYASNASNPSWTFLTTLLPPGPGARTLSATYVLPAGSLQAVRANYRNGGSAGSCTTGSFDDRDDLMFVTIADAGTVTGQVTDALTGASIANAVVTLSPGGSSAVTNGSGNYASTVSAGTYTLTASAPNHASQSLSGVVIANGGTTTVNVALSLTANSGVLTGHVRNATTNAPVANALVTVSGGASSTTDTAGLYALYLPSGVYAVTASATDYADQSTAGVAISDQTVTTRDFALQPLVFESATYDATLKAPKCGQAGSACDSGTLLVGRDTISGGAEPNQPNTILNSCADGTFGSFHTSQSIDRLRIFAVDGGLLAPGKIVKIETTVWIFDPEFARNVLELYHAADVNNPSWTFITAIFPSDPGAQTLSATLVLPVGGVQAVRARFRDPDYSPDRTPCAGFTDNFDDTDDLIFSADTTPTAPAFYAQPSSLTVTDGSPATFAVAASGQPAPTYQWQVSVDGGMSWTNLTNTALYGGVTTTTLTVSSATASLNNYQFRAVASNSSGSATSNAATLSVINGLTMTTFAGLAGFFGAADGTGPAARFRFPGGVAVDRASGTVYVADTYSHTIRKITPGGVVSTFAGSAGLSGSADGTGGAARFSYPEGVAVDSFGTVYVADTSNNTIRKITPGGVVSTFAGLAGVSGSADGTGTAARFSSPFGVAVDSAGSTIYVADTYNHSIRKITAAGVVTTLAGLAGSSGSTDGTGTGARFSYPQGVAVDGAGIVYVADTSNSTIRKVTAAGVVTTLAGSVGECANIDGSGSAAAFCYPFGVAADSAGSVYVADTFNFTIRKVTAGGAVITMAGSAGIEGSADGTGAAANFSYPQGVAVDSTGTVYVADTGNTTIRKGVPDTGGIPVFTTQSTSQTVNAGQNTAFTVTAGGTSAPTDSSQVSTNAMTSTLGTSGLTAISSSGVGSGPIVTVPAVANPLPLTTAGVAASNQSTTPRDLALQPAASTTPTEEVLEASPSAVSALIARSNVPPFAAGLSTTVSDRSIPRAQVFTATAVARVRKWEIELFGGGTLANHPAGGTAALPGPGAPFTAANGQPSRRESSWYFGDGASLLNQVNAGLGVPQRITPLDGVLNTSVAQREGGGDMGLRVSRIINPRFTAEATVEYGFGRLDLTSAGSGGIEASRATFISAWNGFFSGPGFSGSTVTANAKTIRPGRQLFTTGAVNIALKQDQKMIPYVTVGAGVISNLGDAPSTSLTGSYQFSLAGPTPVHETDSVTLRYVTGNHVFVGVIGGGLKYYVSPRWGVRLDARLYLSHNTIDTLVDTSPRVFTLTPAGSGASANNPAIQFSNSPLTGIQSSLSAPATTGVRTFEGGGVQSQPSVTAGIFRRF